MNIEIRRLSADDIRTYKDGLVELLRDAVDNGSSVNFIAPLDAGVAAAFWERMAGDVDAGQRVVLAGFEADRVVGCVHLALAMQPNGRHRAEVQKVLVHTSARRRGVATMLMQAVEDVARTIGRTTLVLDTERDSGAEKLYEQVGYVRAGVIPQFALDSTGRGFVDTVLFYKLLE